MYPYLICFLITILIAYADERYLRKHIEIKSKNTKVITVIFALLVILLPATLAGLRDYNVGTDVMVYAYQTFNDAHYIHGVGDFFDKAGMIYNSRIESGFFALAWFSTLFSDDPHIFLFFISLFIGIFVYLILYRLRKFTSIWLGETVYLFCFYNETLNMMRQSMAIVMVMYAFTFVYYNRSWFKFCIFAFLSYFFHHSALIGLSLFVPILLLGSQDFLTKDNKKKTFLTFSIVLLFSIISANFVYYANLIMNINDAYTEIYKAYVENMSMNRSDTGIRTVVYYFAPYLLLFLRRNRIRYGYMFLCIALIDSAFYYLRLYNLLLYRVSAFYYWFKLVSLSALPIFSGKTKFSNERIYRVLLVIILFLFWRLNYGGENPSHQMHGSHETIPYKSEILDIR